MRNYARCSDPSASACAKAGQLRQVRAWFIVAVVAGLAGCGGTRSGNSPDGGASSDGGSDANAESSSGCPAAVPTTSACSPEGLVCHYAAEQTDCGCVNGWWSCFSGCSPGVLTVPVNFALCEPQLASTTTCHPYGGICSYTVAIPCVGDGGSPLSEVDAGECATWCAAVADAGLPPGQSTGVQLADAGPDAGDVVICQCGGCGM